MNYYARIFGISFMCSIFAINGSKNHVSPYFNIRSQGENLARRVAGTTNHVNLFDVGRIYGTSFLALEYTKSIKSQRIAHCLFGDDLLGCDPRCRSIKVSGSGVAGRNANKDWLADYFGLPRDYQSTLSFCPRIENVIADFNTYFGFDNWYRGLFLKVGIPLVYTKWNLNFSEECNNPGQNNHHPGYFNGRVTLGSAGATTDTTINGFPATINSYPNAYGVARSNLVNDFASYACNKAVPTLGNGTESVGLPNLSQPAMGDDIITVLTSAEFPLVTFTPLCKAQFTDGGCDNTTKVGIADLQIVLGRNVLQNEKRHFGFGIRAVAPTGNAPDGCTLFEPILGNGNHWGLGVMFTAHTNLWTSEDEQQKLNLFADSNITHLFSAKQRRTFDLKCKPNSRYMLAQKMKSPATNLQGTSEVPNAQFANIFTPLANLSTLKVDVSVGVQTDTVFMISYQHGDFIWDIGYNLWTSSCEKIKIDCDCKKTLFADGKTWALKGDAQVYGYAAATVITPEQNPLTMLDPFGVPLSASQSTATIHGGTNGYTSLDTTMGTFSPTSRPTQNPGINNPQDAQVPSTTPTQVINDNPSLTQSTNPIIHAQVKTSVDPVFITEDDLDINGNRTKGISHKIFTNIAYTWVECNEYVDPYIGFGAECELHDKSDSCNTDVDCCPLPCRKCGLSQWGVWAKGGLSFD